MTDHGSDDDLAAEYIEPPSDHLQRFLFESRPVRGALVHIRDGWAELGQQRDYPTPARDLLGRAFAAAALMASTIKFEGRMNLQLQGSGPISLLLVQIDHLLHMRGVVRHTEIPATDRLQELTGDARMALMIDPASGASRYQTLVSLAGETLADSLADYFRDSEQLPTWFYLAADKQGVAGLMLQRMPAVDDDPDAVEQVWQLTLDEARRLSDAQLLASAGPQLMADLFGDNEVRAFRPREVDLGCRCSHATISAMLLGLGREEAESIIEDVGRVEVECGFCGETYVYDAGDITRLFAASESTPPTPSQH